MASEITLEENTLYQVVMDMLGEDSPLAFDHGLPLYSADLTQGQVNTIRDGLERRLRYIPKGFVPVVTPIPAIDEGQAPSLRVRFFELYRKERDDTEWYADFPSATCWHFMTANERSASALCSHWNTSRNREYLESVRPNVGVERDTLRLHLLQLRDSGIRITKFGYKCDGFLEDL